MIESAFFEVIRDEIEKEVREETWKKAWEEGREEGREEGIVIGMRTELLDAIAWALEFKFGAEGLKLWPEIRQIEDIETLRVIQRVIRSASTVEDVRAMCRALLPETPEI